MSSFFLALDIGLKRVGVAISDPSKKISFPQKVIDFDDIISFIETSKKEILIEKIILGNPINMDGSESNMSLVVKSVKKKLSNKFTDLKVILFDERLTSKLSRKKIFEVVKKKKYRKDKKNIDIGSAVIILQNYLDNINAENNK